MFYATADSSAYSTLKSQTKANLRAALHTVEKVDEKSAVLLAISSNIPSKPIPSDPSNFTRLSSASVGVGARPSGLNVHLDIAAPRILLPERLWPASSEKSTPTPDLLGVICDFGRFRLSNWEPAGEKEGNSDQDPSLSYLPVRCINIFLDLNVNLLVMGKSVISRCLYGFFASQRIIAHRFISSSQNNQRHKLKRGNGEMAAIQRGSRLLFVAF